MPFLSHPQPEKTQQLVFPSSQARNPGLYVQNYVCNVTYRINPFASKFLGAKLRLIAHQNQLARPFTEESIHAGYREQRNQAVTALEASSLFTSTHSVRRFYESYWGRKAMGDLIQFWATGLTMSSCQPRQNCECNSGMTVLEATNCFLLPDWV